jgi:hypothetical protein
MQKKTFDGHIKIPLSLILKLKNRYYHGLYGGPEIAWNMWRFIATPQINHVHKAE